MIIIICIILLIITIIYVINYVNHPPLEKKLKHIKGPEPEFFLGNARLFAKDGPGITRELCRLYKEYASPMKIKLGPYMLVHIYRADHMEAALSSTVNIRKTPIDYELIIKEWLGNGLLVSTGDVWRMKRKLLTPAFHYAILQDNVPVMNEQADILVHILREKAAHCKAFDIRPLLSACSLDIICETAMGKMLGAQLGSCKNYVSANNEAALLSFERASKPWFWYPFVYYMTSDGRRMQKALKILHNLTHEVILERQKSRREDEKHVHFNETPVTKNRRAFLDILLDLKDNGQLTDQDVTDEVNTFMFEGHDTTAHGMMWTMYCLGRHADIQQKVRQELQQVVGDSSMIELEHLGKLKYLEQCIKETMRIYPAVPIVARNVEHDFNIDSENVIPAGTMLWINFHAMHRDPKVFPNPMTFDPDRFSQDNSMKRSPFSFTPFSAGPRNCIGQKFAMMEMKIIISQIVRNFVVHAVHSQEEMVESFELILNAENGMIVELTPV